MKNKIFRILGVMLSLTMVVSQLLIPVSVSAAPGDTTWFLEEIPDDDSALMLSGSSLTDVVVADASTIYATTNVATKLVYRSTNSGQSFSNRTNDYDDAPNNGGTPVAIAVAPDNKDAIAVVDVNNAVLVSNDAGQTWSKLPALAGNWAASEILDIAVGPARSGTLLGREYFIAVADPAQGAVNTAGQFGDVLTIGATASWASVGGAAAPDLISGVFDFTSVAVSANFLGDRTVVAVGTGVAAGTTKLLLINTSSKVVIQSTFINNTAIATTTDFDTAANPVDGSILSSEIALPTTFDPTTPGGRRVYVAIASDVLFSDNDVYRVDNDTSRALGAVSGAPIRSVAYSGTNDAGKLFIGQNNNTTVKFTDNPTVTSPTWTTATKTPNGSFAIPATKVRLAADFATTNRVFAATSGNAAAQNNGFFISNDAGVSFDGEAFLNGDATDTVVKINDIELTPDGKTLFMATSDGATISLWKSVTPVTTSSWSRILNEASANTGILALNPAWSTTPALYLAETKASGKIFASQNGGATFSNRGAPTGQTPKVMALQDAQTVYLGNNSSIYKSTNGAFIWGDPVSDSADGNQTSLIVPMTDWVIVGGTQGASYSKNGGTSFSGLNVGLDAGGTFVIADENFATNGLVYAACANSANVFRMALDVPNVTKSAQWDDMALNAAGNSTGIAFDNGALYRLTAVDVDRSLNPQDTPGIIANDLRTMDKNLAANNYNVITTAGLSDANYVYVVDGAVPVLYTYKDYLAVAKPELVAPADNAAIQVDPVTGRSMITDFTWKAMGSGTGFVDKVDFDIAIKSVGFIVGSPKVQNEPVNPTSPFIQLSNLLPNTEYIWRVRAADTVSDDATISQWSAVRTVKVQAGGVVQPPSAGPQIQAPAPGATNLDPKLVGIAWATEPGSTEYTVVVATDAAMTKTVGGTPAKVTTNFYQLTDLTPATTYFYSVQATKPTTGVQAAGTFTTAAPPAPTPTTGPTTQPTPTVIVNIPPAETPVYVWAVIVIGAVLVIAVIILIVRTRRVP